MSIADRDYNEKRDFIRMRLEAPVTLVCQGQALPGVCLDLSSSGMQVEAHTALKHGDTLEVLIKSSHESLADLRAKVEVVRVTPLDNGAQALGLSVLSMG